MAEAVRAVVALVLAVASIFGLIWSMSALPWLYIAYGLMACSALLRSWGDDGRS
jgi:hypothetical protein